MLPTDKTGELALRAESAPDAEFIRLYAERAIDRLGYLDSSAVNAFVDLLKENWSRGPGNGHQELMQWFTAKAAKRQKEAYEASFWHALNAARRDLQRLRDRSALYRRDGSRSPIWAGVKFTAAPRNPCGPARALDNTLLEQHPDLPLAGCDREVCSCQLRLVTVREMSTIR